MVTLEMQHVTRGYFKVVLETPLELQWGRSSLVAVYKLVPSKCNVWEATALLESWHGLHSLRWVFAL